MSMSLGIGSFGWNDSPGYWPSTLARMKSLEVEETGPAVLKVWYSYPAGAAGNPVVMAGEISVMVAVQVLRFWPP